MLKILQNFNSITLSNPFRPVLHNPGMSKNLSERHSLLRVVSKELGRMMGKKSQREKQEKEERTYSSDEIFDFIRKMGMYFFIVEFKVNAGDTAVCVLEKHELKPKRIV